MLVTAFAVRASAQLGVSADRVSLPDGPGTLEGVGENVEIDPNMGTMRYDVPIRVPAGHRGMTPTLSFSYNSSRGSSELGMGWALEVPSIERMTNRGLPDYDRDDLFVANGTDQLVLVDSGDDRQIYRARFEGGFVRYTWEQVGDGQEGFWTAQYPDGRVGTFGATPEGDVVDSARVTRPGGGTFRYHLVAMNDPQGHQTSYSHTKGAGGFVSISHIGWNHPRPGDDARYEMRFAYDSEREDIISDGQPGFHLQLVNRLRSVQVEANGASVREYRLSYDNPATSGGFTRLVEIEEIGAEGTSNPIRFGLDYSRTLGGVCDEGCEDPFLVNMGSVSLNPIEGTTTLIDINGDGLPDLLDTREGEHRFFVNSLGADGSVRFLDPATTGLGDLDDFQLAVGSVQELDIDGDGLADLVNGAGRTLRNQAGGDWSSQGGLDLTEAAAVWGRPNTLFLDIDNDKRIDLLTNDGNSIIVMRNLGLGSDGDHLGFAPVESGLEGLGVGWQSGDADFQLAEMNGDGLLDPLLFRRDSVVHRLNLGLGRWEDEFDLDIELTSAEYANSEFVDINGDGLDDIVIVMADQLHVHLNRAGLRFDERVTVTEAGGSDLPTRDEQTTVFFADMNANGSVDVVWMSSLGQVSFLELFPLRPNLLARVENGLGEVQTVTYGTAAQHRARDELAGRAWDSPLPHPMVVVDSTATTDTLTDVTSEKTFEYRMGFYDGRERQYRGFERVIQRAPADDAVAALQTDTTYDTGREDPYRNGRVLQRDLTSDGAALYNEAFEYGDCAVAEVPAAASLVFAVRFVCPTAYRRDIFEGGPPGERATVRSTFAFDAYGNRRLLSEAGVARVGAGACEPCDRPEGVYGSPCGGECRGDERIVETEYVAPQAEGRWILDRPARRLIYGAEGEPAAEDQFFYDGDPFVGLGSGELTAGQLTRLSRRIDDSTLVDVERYRRDSHGNVVERWDALAGDGVEGHRTSYEFEGGGLFIVRIDVDMGRPEGVDSSLSREFDWDEAFAKPIRATAWMNVADGTPISPENATFFSYDEFGRLASITYPGDVPSAPSEVYAYELGAPPSRLVVRRRSQPGGTLDAEAIRCLDGRGRVFQERTRLSDSTYLVSGFRVRTQRGADLELFQPFEAAGGECDEARPPDDVPATRFTYDGVMRVTQISLPDSADYGDASTVRVERGPLTERVFDAEDTDSTSPHAGTSTLLESDGRGHLVGIVRTDGLGIERFDFTYDGLGNYRGMRDPAGNERVQRYDRAGRLVGIDDPNSGQTTFGYDGPGNMIVRTDGLGIVLEYGYDAANRRVARWDASDDSGTRVEWIWDQAPTCDVADCSNGAGRLAATLFPDGDGVGGDVFGYDPRGRLRYHGRTLDDFTFETEVDHDALGNVTARRFADGTDLSFTHDAASRLVGVPGVLDSVEYDPRGNATRIAYANGVVDERTFSQRNHLVAHRSSTESGDVLGGADLTLDRMGNVLAVDGMASEVDGWAGVSATFEYDAFYRPVEASYPAMGPLDEALSATLSWDALDNLVAFDTTPDAHPAQVGTLAYEDLPNAPSQVGATTYEYDAVGQTTVRGDQTLVWNSAGYLAEVRGEGGQMTFAYDAEDALSVVRSGPSTTYLVGPTFEVRDGLSVRYVMLGGRRVARLEGDTLVPMVLTDWTGDGQIAANDAWSAHDAGESAAADAAVASTLGRLISEEAGGQAFLHTQESGTATLATGADGEVLGRRELLPFGAPLVDDGGWVDTHGLSGFRLHEATGLLLGDGRVLDPRTGRFLSPQAGSARGQRAPRSSVVPSRGFR